MPPGVFVGDSVAKVTEDSLDALFLEENSNTFHQSWQKLNRGSRMDRLRKFVQSYPDVKPSERAALLAAVLQAFELRQLNTKVAIDYDPDTATIISIRGLRERLNTAGFKTFRIDTVTGTVRSTLKQVRAKNLNTPATDI